MNANKSDSMSARSTAKTHDNVEVFIHDRNQVKSLEDFYSLYDTVEKYRGTASFEERLKQRGVKQYDSGHNLVVDAGSALYVQIMGGLSTSYPAYNSVGTSTTAPTAGQTDLLGPIARLAITRIYTSANALKMDTFWNESQGNGSLNETGIHTAATGGTMFSRRVFATTKTKTSSDTMTVKWTHTLTPV